MVVTGGLLETKFAGVQDRDIEQQASDHVPPSTTSADPLVNSPVQLYFSSLSLSYIIKFYITTGSAFIKLSGL